MKAKENATAENDKITTSIAMALCAMEANSWGHVLQCTNRFNYFSNTTPEQNHIIKILLALSCFYDEAYNGCYS